MNLISLIRASLPLNVVEAQINLVEEDIVRVTVFGHPALRVILIVDGVRQPLVQFCVRLRQDRVLVAVDRHERVAGAIDLVKQEYLAALAAVLLDRCD